MRKVIDKIIESAAIGIPLFVFVWFVLPSLKPFVDLALAAASGVSLAVMFVKRAPIIVRCDHCGKIHNPPLAHAGTKIVVCEKCKDGTGHRFFIPRVTIPEFVKQSVQRLLGHSPEDIAFPGPIVPA